MRYVGRFAPSPTGPLHIGSLATGLASFLDARHNRGEWLVRIDDIDPPREAPGAVDSILHALERFDLTWDRGVLYQSARKESYRAAAEQLLERGQAYRCSCTRAELRRLRSSRTHPERYPGICRTKTRHERATAIRVLTSDEPIRFSDLLQGRCAYALESTIGDYVIFRRNGLPAYHLANVIDDAEHGITHVIRGVDLLESTAAHIHLQRSLGLVAPRYGHLPVFVNSAGQKLSKQTGATAVDFENAEAVAFRLLAHLGMEPPDELRGARPKTLWHWATAHWDIGRLAGRQRLSADSETVTQRP